MKSAFVTGADGYIGTWLVDELLKRGVEVTAVIREGTDGKCPPGKSQPEKNVSEECLPRKSQSEKSRSEECLSGRYTAGSYPPGKHLSLYGKNINIVYCDMCDYEKLPMLTDKKEDSVFYHLAWNAVYGPERVNGPLQFANVEGARKAVVAAKALGCSSFIGIGSIMERESVAVTKEDGAKPSKAYIYGEAKHFAHLITKAEAAYQGIPHIWPVLTNPYGENDFSTRFVNMTLNKVLNNESLEFTAGTQLYDFIYVGDVAKALCLLGEKGKPFTEYTVGSGNPRPLREFVEMMLGAVAPDRKPLFGNIPYTGAAMTKEDFSTEKLFSDTGFIPEMDFKEGIIRTFEWLKQQKK